LDQGSTLIPYLFTLVLDVLTKHNQQLAPRCMTFCRWCGLNWRVGGGIEWDVGDLDKS